MFTLAIVWTIVVRINRVDFLPAGLALRGYRTPVFIGTRVPVAVLFENLADGMSLDQILAAYPTLSREVVLAALHEAEASLEREQAAA